MCRASITALLALVCVDCLATTLPAQLFPVSGRRTSNGYDWYDASVGFNAIRDSNASSRDMAQGYQAWRQQAASAGSGYGASAGPAPVSSYAPPQSNRDWWFQTEQRQMAAQQSAAAATPAYVPPPTRSSAVSREFAEDEVRLEASQPQRERAEWQYDSMKQQGNDLNRLSAAGAGFEAESPTAATDIIPWLPVLQAPQFAKQRARIEAPFLRDGAKRLSTPTAKQYEDMIAAAAEMKNILKNMAADVSAEEYLEAVAFLDQLAGEARGRLPKTDAKP
jgi:hypothetical protein